MNENAQKWVEALRGPEYKQGRNRLAYGGSHCCLGVACEVAIKNGVPISRINREGEIYFDESYAVLPVSIREWLGLNSTEGRYGIDRSLASDNDSGGKTFAEIAAIIESEPEGLFVK